MSMLNPQEHAELRDLCLQYDKGNDDTKIVFIRDECHRLFGPYYMKWRLTPDEVGILPGNRDGDMMVPSGAWLRGGKILNSGFSSLAIGHLFAFEDHPKKHHIQANTEKNTKGDHRFPQDSSKVRVGPANWTHSNMFTRMVQHECVIDDPGFAVPIKEGHIDRDSIAKDAKNAKMFEVIRDGHEYLVLPWWVEESYPQVPRIYQAAANQEQQIQEGDLYYVYTSV
jgi:hypothetical protein